MDGMAGRVLRTRMVTIEPGGVFGPIHDHVGRPGTVYILQGTITDHRDGVLTEYGPGVGWPEDRHTSHWLENRGTTPAVEIAVDIVRKAERCYGGREARSVVLEPGDRLALAPPSRRP